MKKNIITLISIVICIFICGFSETNNTEGCSEKTQIQIQRPEKIVTVQLNSMKIDSQEFGKARLSDLVKSMESTILLDEEEANLIQKGDIYSVVIFIPASNEPKSSSLDLGDCREGQIPRSLLRGI